MTPEPTLAGAPIGADLVLTRVAGTPAATRRLAELGLRPGAVLEVVRRTAGNGRVVAVAGSRIALDLVTSQGISVAHHPRVDAADTTQEGR